MKTIIFLFVNIFFVFMLPLFYDIVANMLVCDIVVSGFELKSC